MSEYPQSVEVDAGGEVNAVTFTASGEYLVSGGKKGVQVWRVKDGKRVATMLEAEEVYSLAVSRDGRFIAAGLRREMIFVLDAVTYEQVFVAKMSKSLSTVWDVDFSADSKRLVSADGSSKTATVWDIVASKEVHVLDHGVWVETAKYSLRGDRIATATKESVRIWDGDSGRLLVDVKVRLTPSRGLCWLSDYLLVKTNTRKIKKIDTSTGLTVSEWSVPLIKYNFWIALPHHGRFVAYSTEDNITFWDASTHTQLGLLPWRSGTCSIAFSPDDRLFAILSREKKIVIKTVPVVKEPDICIEHATLDAWKCGRLTDAEASLTAAISASKGTLHTLASRALVRARLRQWDAALVDAEESIKIQSSVVGYIAKCVALVGKGDTHAGCRVCDIASLCFHPDYVGILLLVKAVTLFMAREYDDAISRMDDLIAVRSLDPTFYVVQAYMHLFLANLHVESGDYERAIQSFELARVKLGDCTAQPPLIVSLISGWKFDDLAIVIQRQLCEALFVADRIKEAGESVLRMMSRELSVSDPIKTWATDFMQRCLSARESGQNGVSYHLMPLLSGWAKFKLITGPWMDVLASATGFVLPRFAIYQVICGHLEVTGHVADAVSCFHQMCREQVQGTAHTQLAWTLDFRSRCRAKLEVLGNIALDTKQYDEAVLQYTTALSLEPAGKRDLLIKRSVAHLGVGEWAGALDDANEAIKLDPSSPMGYERRHAALHGMGWYDDATHTFETMLLKMLESPDPRTREQSQRYVRPDMTKETIRATIRDAIRDSPLMLINTISGRLCNKSEQASAFESTPAFMRLISSTTTHIDHTVISEEVGAFYRYATFSHKWEENEPLFEKVIRIVVYDLEASPSHEKLQMFCRIVREAGFNWAWSDTCCINKGDHFVLQEALVSMFKWYERSAMTIIFLRGVGRFALRGALTRSIWNMRGWTLQEYHASKVVQIYTEDWTPYLGLTIYNHKESPEIISEMEEATGISARALKALRPGLNDIREKLRLASTRQTTRAEDAAYSLFGIFSVSLPITYDEGDRAFGRLLSQLLASSGDTSILAWTGRTGGFNSCLPSSIAVFRHSPTSHIPPTIPDPDVGTMTVGLDHALLAGLYDKVNELPVPSFSGLRMKLPCLTFKLGPLLGSQNSSERLFRSKTDVLGIVEVKTQEDLSQLGSLCIVHPWIDFLLDRRPIGGVTGTAGSESTEMPSMVDEIPSSSSPSGIASTNQQTQTVQSVPHIEVPSNNYPTLKDNAASLIPPSILSPEENHIRVLQFIARLRQPFGALLLTPTRRNMDEYRRVAAESLITVQVEEVTPALLDKLMNSVRVLDVL